MENIHQANSIIKLLIEHSTLVSQLDVARTLGGEGRSNSEVY